MSKREERKAKEKRLVARVMHKPPKHEDITKIGNVSHYVNQYTLYFNHGFFFKSHGNDFIPFGVFTFGSFSLAA